MPALVERMEYVMQKYDINTPCDKALLLDYKAELFYRKIALFAQKQQP
jgi:hypothetical protein